jgi:crotonobetainyl-CoA:carnitine CoA-transferase CaiB-like acyl-CoA transferase
MAPDKRKGPLARFTVLDLTRARSGPTAVRQLSDWGANVIKIEEPGDKEGAMDDRRHGPDFQNMHRNKRSVTLNLKSPDGVEVFKRMAKTADVIVENYRPRVKHRLGIDYETMRKINPRIVYASISGFGQDGPYSDRPGLDQVAQGMSGLMSITGRPGEGPMRAGIAIGDSSAGIYLAFGIVTALLEREETGEGQWVSTSLLQALIAMLDFQAARWVVSHEVPEQVGNDHPLYMPTGAFRTADGYINIAGSGNLFPRLCGVLGMPELVTHRITAITSSGTEPGRPGQGDRGRPPGASRRVGRGTERRGRAVRAHLQDERGVRGPSGEAPGHGRAGPSLCAGRHRGRRAGLTPAPDPVRGAHCSPGPGSPYRGSAGGVRLQPGGDREIAQEAVI